MPTDDEKLKELKKQMIALRNAIEDYIDSEDMEKPSKEKKEKKEKE